jgi:hypothetical protein
MEASRAGLPEGRVTIPSDVVRRAFGEEMVLLNLKSGQYHGLNATAGYMLDLLESSGDAAATAEQVARECYVPVELVRDDLADLCRQLLDRGLISVDEP